MAKLIGMLVFGMVAAFLASATAYAIVLFINIIIGGIANADYMY